MEDSLCFWSPSSSTFAIFNYRWTIQDSACFILALALVFNLTFIHSSIHIIGSSHRGVVGLLEPFPAELGQEARYTMDFATSQWQGTQGQTNIHIHT